MKVFFALFFATTLTVAAQTPQVPHKMQFADITLTIRDDARREIQKDVDAFTKYPKSFTIKVERAKTYFPIIEKIFAEENVPDDFKYLVIQESALVPDAVSTSNAVGFWQFKDFTAIEMGLRVDKEIDERLNIVSSSRAAARYLKKNNVLFNNWLFTLQSYQMGAGGVLRSEKESKSGVKNMEVTGNTYWYIKKYLAHKIAYEDAIKGKGEVQLLTYHNQTKRTLSDLAKEISVDADELKLFNKWTKSGTIPDDRVYAVVIPLKGNFNAINLPESAIASTTVGQQSGAAKTKEDVKAGVAKKEGKVKINGINTIKALEGDTPTKIALRAGVDVASFLKWNDIAINETIQPGEYYLLGKKRSRAATAYHQVSEGENLWSISQQHGVQLKKLKKYNRIKSHQNVSPGMTLWLSSIKPKDSDKAKATASVVEVDNQQSFAWSVTSSKNESTSSSTSIQTKPETIQTKEEKSALNQAVVESTEHDDSIKLVKQNPDSVFAMDSAVQQAPAIIDAATKNEHTVQAGETLYGISRQYNVGVMDLVEWNKLDLQQGIKPGQVLKLTGTKVVAKDVETLTNQSGIEHIVVATDTVYSIARKYGVTIKELMDWNNKKDFNLLIGEKLKIPQK